MPENFINYATISIMATFSPKSITLESYWKYLPGLIDINQFIFYNPRTEYTIEDVLKKTSILDLPNNVLDVMINHIKKLIVPNCKCARCEKSKADTDICIETNTQIQKCKIANGKFKITNFKKKSTFMGTHRPLKEDCLEYENSITVNTKEELIETITAMYKLRRTHIEAMKFRFKNVLLYDYFGDLPELSIFICNGIDIDSCMFKSNIIERIEKVNEVFHVKEMMFAYNNLEKLSLLEKILAMETDKDIILRGFLEKYKKA